MVDRICSVGECHSSVTARGLCGKHYARLRTTGVLELVPCSVDNCLNPRKRQGLCGQHLSLPTCSVSGCLERPRGRGLCVAHYQRLQKKGAVDSDRPVRKRRKTPGVCAILGCGRSAYFAAKQWCSMHYQRFRKHGDPLWVPAPRPPCRREGCTRDISGGGRGFCQLHYARVLATGDPGPIGTTRAPRGQGRTVNKAGYVLVSSVRPNGRSRQTGEHRVVMERQLGRVLNKWENIHHINGVTHDNRLENLEIWVKAQPAGQRLDQAIDWWVEHYPEAIQAALAKRRQLTFDWDAAECELRFSPDENAFLQDIIEIYRRRHEVK